MRTNEMEVMKDALAKQFSTPKAAEPPKPRAVDPANPFEGVRQGLMDQFGAKEAEHEAR